MHMHYAMVKVRERSYFQLKKGASSKCWIVTGGKIHLRHATLPSTMHGDLHIRVVLIPITVLEMPDRVLASTRRDALIQCQQGPIADFSM